MQISGRLAGRGSLQFHSSGTYVEQIDFDEISGFVCVKPK